MKKRYSILTDDLETCIECGRNNVELHEIFGGNPNRKHSIDDGLIIPLCKELHHRGNLIGIHRDPILMGKWHIKGQRAYMKQYKKTVDEFIKRYGRNYL